MLILIFLAEKYKVKPLQNKIRTKVKHFIYFDILSSPAEVTLWRMISLVHLLAFWIFL